MIHALILSVVVSLSTLPFVGGQTAGTTTTTWDCCEPACGYTSNLSPGAKGPVKSCNQSNGPAAAVRKMRASRALATSRSRARPTSRSSSIVPFPTASQARKHCHGNCCMCYEFTWTSGAAAGKSMIVQAINAGGITDVDFDIYTPGGGVGDYNACTAQYGAPSGGWGRQYGGVTSDSQCSELPSNLQAGCHWRWEWAGGDVNEWDVTFKQVNCPSQLTSISGCTPASI
ncbi:putative endoglucanase type K [Grifola frondosa]|uniref:cellulase n=1 Tax=Grifola frondosa TaxID=5627 RepID=A0A1C7M992_GRIFR|nr:putative endoglucanase type K [Grifola frondosa]